MLFLLGRTQTRKSSLAALMLSFYGRFTALTLPSSFKDTSNAIEKKCSILKDVLTVIDDYLCVSHYKERQDMYHTAHPITRGYGDRTGRDRMNADLDLNSAFIPHGNAIITGEDFPQIGQSGTARNFIVEINPNDMPVSPALNAVQEAAADGTFSKYMCGYIGWLSGQTAELLKS